MADLEKDCDPPLRQPQMHACTQLLNTWIAISNQIESRSLPRDARINFTRTMLHTNLYCTMYSEQLSRVTVWVPFYAHLVSTINLSLHSANLPLIRPNSRQDPFKTHSRLIILERKTKNNSTRPVTPELASAWAAVPTSQPAP